MGTNLLKGEVLMGLECVTLMMSLIKGVYVGHLQWDSMKKYQTAWANIYGYGVLEMGDTIFSRDSKKSTDTECPNRGPWFENFILLYTMRMLLIKKIDFGVTSETAKALLVVWDIE